MTAEEFQKVIQNRAIAELRGGTAPKVALIVFDNDGKVPDGTKEFIKQNILHGPNTIAHSTRRTEYSGVVNFDIFVPVGEGSGRLAEIADLISAVFSHLEGDEFRLEGAGILNLGKIRDSYQYQVSFNFTRQEARQSRTVTVNC